MQADMTVGLDLKCLENLKIFNGYEKERNRKLSNEASSADDNESDTGQGEWTPSKEKSSRKCGRPANPIPRHKRDSHIKAEYKRRDKIQKGFDSLLSIVPELTNVSEKESKAKMLFKTADYCRRLKSECGSTQTELTALRQELASIGTEIQELQDKLPKNGVDTVKICENVTMDSLYDQYVLDETKKNWKFWIFRFFLHPLYKSYKQVTSGKQESQEFNKNVYQWIQSSLSLGNLRKGFLDSLRTISKCTSIMTTPEKLKEEAISDVHDFYKSTKKESLDVNPSTPISERSPTSVPLSSNESSPGPSSSSTPPRTPHISRRSSKREIQRSSNSRSRSNSPAQAESVSKRRSSYRSRSGRRVNDDQDVNGEYATPVGNPNLPLLSQLLTSPHILQTTQYRGATDENTSLITNYQRSPEAPSVCQNAMDTAQNKLSVSVNFVESPIISVGTNVDMTIPKLITQSQFTIPYVSTISPSVTTSLTTEPISPASTPVCIGNYSNKSELVNMDYSDTSISAGFTPSLSSRIISNSITISQEGCHVDSNQNVSSDSFKIQPDNLFLTTSGSDDTLTEMPNVTSAMSSNNNENFVNSQTVEISKVNPVSHDDDSMFDLLSFDVMDVGTVMKFFSEDKLTQS